MTDRSKLDAALDASRRPEHDKLMAVQDESQAVGEFIDSLGRLGLVLCDQPSRRTGSRYPTPTSRSINSILAEHFEIDQGKLEQEKRAVLAALGMQA